jgi:NAD(P)-dependent dehydrogenase (short-subunit alcohol dehydrogenase family)
MPDLAPGTFRPDLFAGEVVLVVGGTSGIGAAIADAFAELGAVVTVTGATAADCAAARSSPEFRCRDAVAVDVRDETAMADLVRDLPRLDALVNCAGILRRGAEHDLTVFEEVLAINLTGTMRACTLARAKLKAAAGAIVNSSPAIPRAKAGLRSSRSRSRSRTRPTAFASMRLRRAGWRRQSRNPCATIPRATTRSSPARRSAAGRVPTISPAQRSSCARPRPASSPARWCRSTAAI